MKKFLIYNNLNRIIVTLRCQQKLNTNSNFLRNTYPVPVPLVLIWVGLIKVDNAKNVQPAIYSKLIIARLTRNLTVNLK
jgi:hypothetical protein